jgi:CRP-like cAMP-binding protein
LSNNTNLFVDSLPPSEREHLLRHLQPVRLKQKDVVFDLAERIGAVYFPIDCVISLVVPLASGEIIEAAMGGRDGVVGASAALDSKVSLCRGIVQLGGDCLQCEPDTLKRLATERPQLLGFINRHEQTLFAQAQQSAACNVTHPTESRLARWLLRASDLHGSYNLDFTQEFLAEMLGVRRTSITTIARTLQMAGMIKYSRGHIQLLDIEALQDTACECYQTVKTNYDSLLGRSSNSEA